MAKPRGPLPDISRERAQAELLARRVITKSGCWENNRHGRSGSYAHVAIDGHTLLAHRVAAYAWQGVDLDSPLFIRHLVCDNSRCWNPAHLAPGTVQQNNADTRAHGRHRGGRQQPHHAKPEQRRTMVAESGEFADADLGVAAALGLSPAVIRMRRRAWIKAETNKIDARLAAAIQRAAQSPHKWMREGRGLREQFIKEWRAVHLPSAT